MGAPNIKVRKVEIFWNKISLTGCKWSNSNALSTETPVSHSLSNESFFSISAPAASFLPLSGVIRNRSPSIKVRKRNFFWMKISSTDCKLSSLNAPGSETPVSHPVLENSFISFSAFLSPHGALRIGLSRMKSKKFRTFWTKISLKGYK